MVTYKNKTSAINESSTYIISPCSCGFDCDHKLGNGDSFQKSQKVIEQLENLENRKMCGQPVPCARTRWKPSSQQDKLAKANQVILKASILEDKVKDVLTHNLFANGYTCKQENSEKSIRTTVISSSPEPSERNIPFSNIDGLASNTKKHNLSVKEPAAAPSQDVVLTNPEHETIDHVKECNGIPLDKKPLATEHSGRSKFLPRAPPPHKSLPIPKPRKLRTLFLVRQDCVDGTRENNGDQGTLDDSSQTILQQGQNEVDHANDECIISKISDSKHQNILEYDSNVGSSSTDPTPTGVENETDSKSAIEEDGNFKRCSSLSMSLPKQLKLIYEQLPVKNTAVEKHLASSTPAAGSPRVAPKKPQRFSLPTAGLLKKAASEEKLHSSNDRSYGTLGHGETSQNPSQTSEKPSWKLEHPILPFLGNPELLKTSLSNDSTIPLTKPRAKSLSSVDMNRIENHTNESPKKNTLRKFLNLKLSVCVIKNDFQKFLSRGSLSLSGDCSTSDIFSCAGHSTSPVLEKKIKPSKAHSVDSFSPLSKKKQKNKNDFSSLNNPTSKSLDDSLISLQSPQVASSTEIPEPDIPQYENI